MKNPSSLSSFGGLLTLLLIPSAIIIIVVLAVHYAGVGPARSISEVQNLATDSWAINITTPNPSSSPSTVRWAVGYSRFLSFSVMLYSGCSIKYRYGVCSQRL
jgi:hypothetical protein